MGNHTFKFGVDIRRAYNLRVPSDRHRSGELTFNAERTSGPGGGGLGLATFLLGDVTHFGRYISPITDARERQWRHFYYAQDTWRATQKLTLNYGLRLDVINPQTVNDAGNGGFMLATSRTTRCRSRRRHLRRRRRRRAAQRRRREHDELGAAPRRRLPAERQDGDPRRLRPQLRHRRVRLALRPHRDAEPARAVGAGPQRREQLRRGLQPRAGTAGADRSPRPARTARSRCRTASSRACCPTSSACRPSTPTTSPSSASSRRLMSVEVAYVGNHGPRVFVGDGPDANPNQPTLAGFPACPARSAASVLLAVRMEPGPRRLLQLRERTATTRCRRSSRKRFPGGYSVFAQYTFQHERQHGDDQFFIVPDLEYGPADWDRVHSFSIATTYELPWMKTNPILGGWQFNQNTIIQSGLPFNVTYRDAGADRDVGPNRPNLIGDHERAAAPRTSGSTRRRSEPRAARSPVRRSARSATCRATTCADRATGGWMRRSSSASGSTAASELELRIEVGERVQPRQPGQPRFRDRRARQQQRERRADHVNGVLRRRSAAQLPVRGEVHLLVATSNSPEEAFGLPPVPIPASSSSTAAFVQPKPAWLLE